MSINPGAAEFPHRQIAAQLKERIRRGDWQPGERLPSIPAMAEIFGVAKQTVQRAVDQLPRQGDRMPWLTSLDYRGDVKLLRADSVADPELHFSRAGARTEVPA